MQLRSKRAEHQTANPFLSLSLSPSLSFSTLWLQREKKPFLSFSHSLLLLKYLTNFLLAFREFFFYKPVPLPGKLIPPENKYHPATLPQLLSHYPNLPDATGVYFLSIVSSLHQSTLLFLGFPCNLLFLLF